MSKLINIRLSEEDQKMIEIKAAVYTRGNASELMRQAVAAYREPLPAKRCVCGGTMEQALAEHIEWPEATFDHVPCYHCAKCGRDAIDEPIVAIMEEYADKNASLDFASILQPVSNAAATI